jgi:hypothetical protein
VVQEGLSPQARRFLELAESRPWMQERSSYRALDELQGELDIYKYRLQSWPVLIDAAKRRELEHAGVGLSKLIRQIPSRLFENDASLVADFYDLNSEAQASLLLSEPNGLDSAMARGDFIDSPDGLLCLELNLTRIGAWQTSAFASVYVDQPAVRELVAETGIGLSHTDAIRALFAHVIEDCLADPGLVDDELNLALVVSDTGPDAAEAHPVDVYRRHFDELLRGREDVRPGFLEVVTIGELEVRKDRVAVRGRRIHGLIEQQQDPTPLDVHRAFKAGLIHLYNGPVGWIVGDKKNLAVLSELSGSALFSDEERRLIERHVPWTRVVREGRTHFRGEEVALESLLHAHRELFVLKQSRSYGGTDVHLGWATDDATWDYVVEQALASSGWIVQQRVSSRPYLFQAGERGCCPHEVVWGVFAFGSRYGGAMIRLAPRSTKNIVNVKQGAHVGVVFEVEEPSAGEGER